MADGDSAGARKSEMLAPIGRIEPRDQSGELFEIGPVNALGAADRQIEPVRDQCEMTAEEIEFVELLLGGVEKMVGGHFEEIDCVAMREQIGAKG